MTDAFFEAVDSILDETLAKKTRAQTTLSEAQTYIDYGNKVFLLTPSVVNQPIVVGRIVKPDDWADLRSLVENVQLTPDSTSDSLPSDEELAQEHDQGYRLGLFFDEDHDMGYVASYHISRLYPLTDSEFEGIRNVNCDVSQAAQLPFFGELEDNIITAVEDQPGSPYRKKCDKCGSGRVMLAEYFEGVNYSPIALQMNIINQNMEVLTAHAIKSDLVKPLQRVFHCLECKWESEELSQEEYPEVHRCNHNKSTLEALFDVQRFVI